jgi:hypothetical protein
VKRPVLGVLLSVALAAAAHVSALAALAAPAACDGATTALRNGGFETPGTDPDTFQLYDASLVPPWQTTDVAGQIEIWGDTFNGVPAAEGGSFAELNANSAGTLYQDVITTPGQTMHWSLVHRARAGTDVMQVLIGDANSADPNSATGWDFTSPDLSDDTTAWGTHSGDYVVPAGQTCTRFGFRAVSSGAGDDSFGNFLDAVGFSIPIAPSARPSIHVTQPPTDGAGGTPFVDRESGGPLPAAVLVVAAAVAAGLVGRRLRDRDSTGS